MGGLLIDDLRHFRSDPEGIRRVAYTILLTAAALFIAPASTLMDTSIAAPQEPSSSTGGTPADPAEATTDYMARYESMKFACMNERLRITWVDPHTGVDMAAVCDVVPLGRLPQ